MTNYYVNKNSQHNGDHEVHSSSCLNLPAEFNRIFLGCFADCKSAVKEAKKTYPKSNGCYHCIPECHTS
ncbi:hypothetical protein [Mangrovibacterium lignilyticum]|uniref:hypothetical protein n=1 Tax=Mangrovibacterium lignilyticum TaxID=2668052 RepID=UPI0013D6683D|nr:hypothetical protein [Mangrovibacterium lignilyticum]